MLTPLSGAQGITLDGVLSETEWMLWFEDEGEPGFTVYYATDVSYVYIGIILKDDNTSNDHLQFAFHAEDIDYKIKIKHDTIICYRPSGGTSEGWWRNTIWGLPPGVEMVVGSTEGKSSYEICIAKSTLGTEAEDFPDDFKIWIMYISDNPDGGVNYYPNVYAGWWWVHNQDSGDDIKIIEETAPEFRIPEVPYGTVISVATMIGVFLLFAKRDKSIQL